MARPAPSPKYILKGPRKEEVTVMQYSKAPEKDEEGNLLKTEEGKVILGPLEYKPVVHIRECYMLFMPSGPNGEFNSIRITSPEQLRELGLDPTSTPLIDPETGETVGSFSHRVSQDYGPETVLSSRKKGAE